MSKVDEYDRGPSSLENYGRAINELHDGYVECNSTVTFTANSTTTTLTDRLIHANSVVLLSPTTSNAAGENWYIGTYSNGSCVITHANTSTTDRTFTYVVLGS